MKLGGTVSRSLLRYETSMESPERDFWEQFFFLLGDSSSLQPEVKDSFSKMSCKDQASWLHAHFPEEDIIRTFKTLKTNQGAQHPSIERLLRFFDTASSEQQNLSPVVSSHQKDGLISGRTAPGRVIEARNLSSYYDEHISEVAFSGSDGFFRGGLEAPGEFWSKTVSLHEGDFIQIRSRDKQGKVSDWITFQARGIAASDQRPALFRRKRVEFSAVEEGKVQVLQNSELPCGEPHSSILFRNERTGKEHKVVLNELGNLPEGGVFLKGEKGDFFEVCVSDGFHNSSFEEVDSRFKVPRLPVGAVDKRDPSLSDSHLAAEKGSIKLERFSGGLVVDGLSSEDVFQGEISNCFFAAMVSATAQHHPELLREMMKENDDGSFTFRFQNKYTTSETITVDGDLWTNEAGTPVYGRGKITSNPRENMELWYPLLEKAYAQLLDKRGYEGMNHGGSPSSAAYVLFGHYAKRESFASSSLDSIFQKLQESEQKNFPTTISTKREHDAPFHRSDGLVPYHCYSFLRTEVSSTGERFLYLRNPWGKGEVGSDESDDGIFRVPFEQCSQFFEQVDIAEVNN